jgi:hypothetical protein
MRETGMIFSVLNSLNFTAHMFKPISTYRCKFLLVFLCLSIVCVKNPSLGFRNDDAKSIPKISDAKNNFFYGGNYDERIKKKYADLLKVEATEINKHFSLYKFIDRWIGTPYKWGGCDSRGIDCSCFVMTLFEDVFNIKIKRTTFTQFYDRDVLLFKNPNQYQLGDLLFFKTSISRETRNNRITHVGFYLTNGYFIQSSSSGVNIANIRSGYWKNCFVAAGRLQESFYTQTNLAMNVGKTKSSHDFEIEENSAFDPVPYPEDFEVLKKDYAGLLKVDPDKMLIPEIFNFIEQNRYAPFSLNNKCAGGLTDANCFVAQFYKSIFNLSIDATTNGLTNPSKTIKLKPNDPLSVSDMVVIKSNEKGNVPDIIGIYLYNNFFLHVFENELAISNLDNIALDKSQKTFYRFNEATLKRAYLNLMEKRKNLQGESTSPSDSAFNILKKDAAIPKLDSAMKEPLSNGKKIKKKAQFKSNL